MLAVPRCASVAVGMLARIKVRFGKAGSLAVCDCKTAVRTGSWLRVGGLLVGLSLCSRSSHARVRCGLMFMVVRHWSRT